MGLHLNPSKSDHLLPERRHLRARHRGEHTLVDVPVACAGPDLILTAFRFRTALSPSGTVRIRMDVTVESCMAHTVRADDQSGGHETESAPPGSPLCNGASRTHHEPHSQPRSGPKRDTSAATSLS